MTTDLAVTATRPRPETARPLRTHEVRGGGGTLLRAREWGDPDGAEILFVHGWSQADLCWSRQVGGPLARDCRLVTFDLRGHGASEKPRGAEHYTDERLWAADLAAVIDQTSLERPVVVAWSYAGLVVGDYLRARGDGRLAGIVLVGAAGLLAPPTFDHIGPGFLEFAEPAGSPDPAAAIAAIIGFLRACTARPLDPGLWNAALCWNMLTPPEVRAALLARETDAADALARVEVPVLVAHGRQDAVVLPSMGERALAACPAARASWYEGVGHLPFAEAPDRFDRELAAFVTEAAAHS